MDVAGISSSLVWSKRSGNKAFLALSLINTHSLFCPQGSKVLRAIQEIASRVFQAAWAKEIQNFSKKIIPFCLANPLYAFTALGVLTLLGVVYISWKIFYPKRVFPIPPPSDSIEIFIPPFSSEESLEEVFSWQEERSPVKKPEKSLLSLSRANLEKKGAFPEAVSCAFIEQESDPIIQTSLEEIFLSDPTRIPAEERFAISRGDSPLPHDSSEPLEEVLIHPVIQVQVTEIGRGDVPAEGGFPGDQEAAFSQERAAQEKGDIPLRQDVLIQRGPIGDKETFQEKTVLEEGPASPIESSNTGGLRLLREDADSAFFPSFISFQSEVPPGVGLSEGAPPPSKALEDTEGEQEETIIKDIGASDAEENTLLPLTSEGSLPIQQEPDGIQEDLPIAIPFVEEKALQGYFPGAQEAIFPEERAVLADKQGESLPAQAPLIPRGSREDTELVAEFSPQEETVFPSTFPTSHEQAFEPIEALGQKAALEKSPRSFFEITQTGVLSPQREDSAAFLPSFFSFQSEGATGVSLSGKPLAFSNVSKEQENGQEGATTRDKAALHTEKTFLSLLSEGAFPTQQEGVQEEQPALSLDIPFAEEKTVLVGAIPEDGIKGSLEEDLTDSLVMVSSASASMQSSKLSDRASGAFPEMLQSVSGEVSSQEIVSDDLLKIHQEKGPVTQEGLKQLEEREASHAYFPIDGEEMLEENVEISIEEGEEFFTEKRKSSWFSGLSQWITEENHPSKAQKYRCLLEEYVRILQQEGLFTHPEELDKIYLLHQTSSEHVLYACSAKVLDLLFADLEESIRAPRKRYAELVMVLRAGLTSTEYGQDTEDPDTLLCKRIFQSLCYARWAKVNVFAYLKQITDLLLTGYARQFALEPFALAFTAEQFASTLRLGNQAIKQAPLVYKKPRAALELQKASGTFQLKDFTAKENIPYVRFWQGYQNTQGEVRAIAYLRHGSPTTSGSLFKVGVNLLTRLLRFKQMAESGESIASDYEAFVAHAGSKNQGILYVIHQRLLPDLIEDESERVRVIRSLQEKYPHFHALVQPVEGPLFEKKEEYAPLTTFLQLKNALWEDFTGRNKLPRSALPLALQNEDRYKDHVIPHLLEDVHLLFFKGKEEVASLEEWQTYILLFYVFQKVDLKLRLGEDKAPIAFYTTACKDFLDRGGNMALVEDFVHACWLGRENDPQLLQEIFYNILGAPIAIKRKEVISSRLESGLVLIDYLVKYFAENPDKKEALHNYSFHHAKWRIFTYSTEGFNAEN